MLRFLAFASVSGVVTNAAAVHAVRTDLPHLGVRALSLSRLTTVRRSVMMCATPSGKTWNDIVKQGFSRTATPAEFCRRIQRAVLTDMEDAAYILHNTWLIAVGFPARPKLSSFVEASLRTIRAQACTDGIHYGKCA